MARSGRNSAQVSALALIGLAANDPKQKSKTCQMILVARTDGAHRFYNLSLYELNPRR